jgi:NAD(P)-dependent dehydrogenase (short-subunit alcohol dehydrogenase family)
VHLIGSFLVTKAAWPILAAKRYGRIVFTTSQVGFYGKVDSVAYGAAKMGLVGLMHGIKLSADPLGIKVNCISPFALTRLGDIFPKEIAAYIDPAQVAAAVVLLCGEQCAMSGEVLIAGGGHFATARMLESRGIDIDDPAQVSAEIVAERLGEISDMRDPLHFPDALKAVGATFDRVKAISARKPA